jgi:hypothetical protein
MFSIRLSRRGTIIIRSDSRAKREIFPILVPQMEKRELRRLTPEQEAIREPLEELHSALLKLHKALLDSEKILYEKNVGPIQSPNHFFQLLTSDPYFAWLRPISQLIVAIDETLDAKEDLTNASVDSLMSQSVFLLVPAQSTGEFA